MNTPTQAQLNTFLEYLKKTRKSPKTIRGYRYDLCPLVTRRVALEPEVLDAFISVRPDGQLYAVRTRNRRLAAVRQFIHYLISTDTLTEDPTATLSPNAPRRGIRVLLGIENLRRVLAALREKPQTWLRVRNETIFKLFYNTGLRLSELHRLNLAHVQLRNLALSGVKRKGPPGDPLSQIILNDESILALEHWLQARPETDDTALFISSQGYTRLSERMVQKMLRKLGAQAGSPVSLSPHVLRHEFSSGLLFGGAPLEARQILMNHQDPKTTLIYTHYDVRELRGYTNRIPPLDKPVPTDSLIHN